MAEQRVKQCQQCGATFCKPRKLSWKQWEARAFCSHECRCLSARRDTREPTGRVKVWHEGRKRWRSHVVMEQAMGRHMEPGEVVDHINGDCTDDRPENLRLFASHSEHMRAHWREGTIRKVPGVMGVTEVYRPKADEWPGVRAVTPLGPDTRRVA